jgi:hypothetical protein
MHAAAWSELLPPVLGAIGGRVVTPPRRWMVIWCLLLVANAAISLALPLETMNNLWVGYLFMSLTGAVALWALSHWHAPGTGRLTLRLAIPLFVGVSAVLTLRIENTHAFSLVAAPFHGLVLLLAGIWTFIRLSLAEAAPLLRRDWFWTLAGFMLWAGTTTALEPVAWYLLSAERVDLVGLAINVKAASDLLAFAAITWGVLCPVPPPTSSGGSSSLPSSPWASWSAPSASRW